MNIIRITKLLASILAGSLLAIPAGAQSAAAAAKTAPPTNAAFHGGHSRYRPSQFSRRANLYYSQVWGVDSLAVKTVESGEIVRFTYRVLDRNKAKALNDKKVEPALIDPQAGVSLVVPSVAKVGKLRQSGEPEVGKVYWMAFSNKGRPVKPGHRVNVVIGSFRANGLEVQ
jgi:hypothetical protein